MLGAGAKRSFRIAKRCHLDWSEAQWRDRGEPQRGGQPPFASRRSPRFLDFARNDIISAQVPRRSKSARALAHSKTLSRGCGSLASRQVLECGGAPPLSDAWPMSSPPQKSRPRVRFLGMTHLYPEASFGKCSKGERLFPIVSSLRPQRLCASAFNSDP